MSGKSVGTMFVGKRKGVEVDCIEYACILSAPVVADQGGFSRPLSVSL